MDSQELTCPVEFLDRLKREMPLVDESGDRQAVDVRPLAPGDEFAGHLLIERIGAGGMGEVWKAREAYPTRTVALKLIKPQLFADRVSGPSEQAVRRFRIEVETAAQLEHPHIVPLYHAGDENGRLYYTMQFVEGRNPLRAIRGLLPTMDASQTDSHPSDTVRDEPVDSTTDHADRRDAPITVRIDHGHIDVARLAVKYVAQACRGVAYAHNRGYLHRDIKPDNLIIADSDDTARVADFGLAKVMAASHDLGVPAMYRAGTRGYMAPEQETDAGQATVQSDIYGLGATLFALLTGAPPSRPTTGEARSQIIDAASGKAVHPDLAAICLKCLQLEPDHRYASATDLADDLQRFLELRPVAARPLGRVERLRYWFRRSPGLAVASLSAVLFGLVLVFGIPIAALVIRDAQHTAEMEQQQAEFAETQRRTTAANLRYQRSRTAREKGDWNEVLKHLDDDELADYPDAVLIAMERAKAYRSLGDNKRWMDEVETLAARADLVQHRGALLIMHADVLRFRGELEASMELIREALNLELAQVDRLYAEALISETTPECLENLRLAVSRDPYHYEATMMLVASLVLSGRRDEARERAVVAANLFPGDAGFALWLAVMAAAESNHEEMERWIAQIGEKLDEETKELLLSALKTGAAFADDINDMDLKPFSGIRNWSRFVQLAYVVRKIQSHAGQDQISLQALTRCLPPAFHRAYEPFAKLSPTSLAVLFLNTQKLADQMEEAGRVHPEGTLYLMLGGLHSNAERFADAEQAFFKAAKTPSILPGVNREAWLLAAAAANIQAADGDAEALERAVGYVRERVRLGASPQFHSELFLMIANDAQDYDLAQMIIWQVLQAEDQDTEWLLSVAELETRWAKWQSALHVLDRLLSHEPENKKAQQLKAEILAAQNQAREQS